MYVDVSAVRPVRDEWIGGELGDRRDRLLNGHEGWAHNLLEVSLMVYSTVKD